MPSSLTSGAQLRKDRLAKIVELVKGAKIFYRSGSTQTNDLGSTTIYAGPTAILRLVPGTKPGTCTVGDLCADSADGNKLYQCTATNTWTKVGTQA